MGGVVKVGVGVRWELLEKGAIYLRGRRVDFTGHWLVAEWKPSPGNQNKSRMISASPSDASLAILLDASSNSIKSSGQGSRKLPLARATPQTLIICSLSLR